MFTLELVKIRKLDRLGRLSRFIDWVDLVDLIDCDDVVDLVVVKNRRRKTLRRRMILKFQKDKTEKWLAFICANLPSLRFHQVLKMNIFCSFFMAIPL